MATLTVRQGLDLPQWEVLGNPVVSNSIVGGFAAGTFIAEDRRNNDYAHPINYYNPSTSKLCAYYPKQNGWYEITNAFGGAGTFGTGACAEFVPSMSPTGTVGAGCTTTSIVISSALPNAVLANQIANRGDGKGFIIRIIGNAGGSSGKTEERRVIANTSGTTPTLTLESALSFTPANGDRYEFLSGSYVLLATGALTANQFRKFDCLTGTLSSLSTTGLIATVPSTGNCLIPLESGYVPHTRLTGEGQIVNTGTTYNGGVFECLQATASAAGTLTGHAAGGDSWVITNQFRNYQIRIVEDTGTPTAVGQKRRISSHTAGASPVYTLASSWSVTPSATAKYVIEHFDDRIIGIMGGTTTVYNYSISANAWDTTTWAARGSSAQTTGAYCFLTSGIKPNVLGTYKSGNVVCFRGGSNTPDVLDITGAATGSWTTAVTMFLNTPTSGGTDQFAAGDINHFAYNPHTQDGKYLYLYNMSISTASTSRSAMRIDISSFVIEKIAGIPSVSGVLALQGAKLSFVTLAYDGTNKLSFWNTVRPGTQTDYWRLLCII